MAAVCPGTADAQEAILTDNSTVVAAKPKTVPTAASQGSLRVVGPADARVECDALLKFDLSTLPAGTASTNILKATLILYVNTLIRSGTFDVASIGGAWSERTVTWATAPALIQVEAAGVVPSQNQFVAVNLTELVKNWVDGTITNNGIAIIPNTSSVDALLDGKANTGTSHQPQLVIATSQNVSLFPNDAGYVTTTVTNAVAQTNGTYSGMSAGSATFASNSGSLGGLSTSGWSNFVSSVTNGLPDVNSLAGKAATNQNISLFPNDANYVTRAVTNGLPDVNTLAGKAATNLFSGSNTGLVANAGAPDPSKFLRQDGSWSAPAGATNGFAYLNDLDATNNAIRTGSQAVTNGLPDANALAGKAATNQFVSLFPNDANYVTKTVTNGLPDANTLAGKAATNQFVSLFPNDAGYVTQAVTNGLPDANALAGKAATNQNISLFPNDANYVTRAVTNGLPDVNAMAGKASTNIFSGSNTGLVANAGAPDPSKYLRQDGSWTAPVGSTNGFAYIIDLNATNAAIRTGSQAVTNGLPDANALAGKAATNQFVSLFPNDVGYVTTTVTNAVAQTNGMYSGMSAGSATFAANSASLGNLSTSGWSNFVNSVTNGLPDVNTLAGKAATNQNVSLFPNDANYVTKTVTNGLPDANTLAGKASTNLFSGSNTGLVANAGAPDPTKFLRQDGSWTAPAGATNGLAYLNDLNATNVVIRIGSQAVTNGLPDANTLAGKAATNQNLSLFPNDVGYVTTTVTNAAAQTNGTYSGMSAGSATFATTAGSLNGSGATATYSAMSVGTATFATAAGSLNGSGTTATYSGMSVGTATFASNSASLGNLSTSGWSNFVNSVTNAAAQTNGTYLGMTVGTATFATFATDAGTVTFASVAGSATFAVFASNSGNLGGLSTSGWSNFVNSVTDTVAQTSGTYSGMSAGTATFASNSGSLGNLSTSGWSNFVNSVTNGLPDANTLAGKASTNLFSGSNTGLVANAGAPDPSKFLRQDGSWTAPAGATNGLAYLNDLNATNDAIRTGSQAVTNGLPDDNTLAGKAATNQFVSLFPNDANYVMKTVTNGLPDASTLAGKAATNQNLSLFPNDANYVTKTVTNGLPDVDTLAGKASTNLFSGSNTGLVANAGAPDPTKFLRQDGSWTAPAGATNGLAYLNDLNATNDAIRTGAEAVTNDLPDANTLAGKAATNQFVSLFPNDAGYVTMALTNGLETITAAIGLASTNTAPSALTNATFTLGVNFTNGNFRCFYAVSVSMVSTTVVDFINLTDATTNTISVADVGGLILTNSVFQFAGPNEVFIINTNRSGAGQAPSLISVTGKIL
jgi:ribonuclease HI